MRLASNLSKKKKKDSKKDTLFVAIFALILGIALGVKGSYDYYWEYQIRYHGIKTKGYIYEKEYSHSKYIVKFFYQTDDGNKIFSDKKITIPFKYQLQLYEAGGDLWYKKSISILYAPQNPKQVMLNIPIEHPHFIRHSLLYSSSMILFLSFMKFLEWRKME